MSLHLYDTATRSLRAFVPLRPPTASMYVCGAAMQGVPHIGHVRSALGSLAQSRAAGDGFAWYWLHNGWVMLSGEKMTKSLGNTLSIPATLRRVRAVELRYYLIAAHYRSAIEYSDGALDEAVVAYRRIESFVHRVRERCGVPEPRGWCAEFVRSMDDDLGTPAALAAVHATVHEGNAALAFLVDRLLAERAEARNRRDYATADALRDQLLAAGIAVEDTPDGPVWTGKGSGAHGW